MALPPFLESTDLSPPEAELGPVDFPVSTACATAPAKGNVNKPAARSNEREIEIIAVSDAGHFDAAHQRLREAKRAQLAAAQQARTLREQAQAAEDSQMLGAASATAVDANVALTERHYSQAAELFSEAAGYVPASHADEQLGYLERQASALYQQGDERGDNDALRNAIGIYRRMLEERTRDRVPLQWAQTQNNLGLALWKLGERERSGRSGGGVSRSAGGEDA